MPKRSVEETNNESPNSEFKYDDSYNQRRKKIEHERMLSKVRETMKKLTLVNTKFKNSY